MTPKSKRTRLVAVLAVALVVIAALGFVAAGCGSSELPNAGGYRDDRSEHRTRPAVPQPPP